MGIHDQEQLDDTDFDGCRRDCRKKGAHTRIWGECEFGIRPEPTVSMSKVYLDTDGHNSIGFDVYTAEELAGDIIEPVLRGLRMHPGSEIVARLNRGESIRPFADEENGMMAARLIARAIVQRNDPPERIPIPGIPECGAECPWRRPPRRPAG